MHIKFKKNESEKVKEYFLIRNKWTHIFFDLNGDIKLFQEDEIAQELGARMQNLLASMSKKEFRRKCYIDCKLEKLRRFL